MRRASQSTRTRSIEEELKATKEELGKCDERYRAAQAEIAQLKTALDDAETTITLSKNSLTGLSEQHAADLEMQKTHLQEQRARDLEEQRADLETRHADLQAQRVKLQEEHQ